ncbi:MAG: DUF4328 domain-containing protein [Actinomycetota bacterium]|nr:DUF4328 domain-containing protein [Actinomycetota bacterium]
MSSPPPLPPPPGYTPYSNIVHGNVQPSKGLSKAMITLYWATTGAAALLALALFLRKGTWDDLVDGNASLSDIDGADQLVVLATVLQVALVIASAVTTALWSRRIASNATARGVHGISTGMAAGAWFIPIGWFWLGFRELRKSGEGVRADVSKVTRWQNLFVAQAAVGMLTRNLGDFDVNDSASQVSSALQNQWLFGVLGVAVYAGATVFARRASNDLDLAVTGA